jgi:hypothetical protein
VRLFTGGKA